MKKELLDKKSPFTEFSYIVMGVFFVYNDSIMILLCVFAVYGVYAMLRELILLFARKKCAVAAVRIYAGMDRDACMDAIRFAEQLAGARWQFESVPVLLCDAPASTEIQNYGYEVYVKQTVTEEECRRN